VGEQEGPGLTRRALITGITGQDGSYLAEFLLGKGYQVIGLVRRSNVVAYERLLAIQDRLTIVQADLSDQASLIEVVERHRPDEVYNLAGYSVPVISWSQPALDGDITGVGVTRLLEAVRLARPQARLYQASTSEMFGDARESPQTERTPFAPRNPYGVSKLYGHWMTVTYRKYRNVFASSGILYNHESPRRGMDFVPRKITHAAAAIKLGLAKELSLGDLDARRDWGFAGDYVRAMWMMLQAESPDDYIIATGETHSVTDLCSIAFEHVGLDYRDHVRQDPRFVRPAEGVQLVGDATKAHQALGWRPSIDFRRMVEDMVEADLEHLSQTQS